MIALLLFLACAFTVIGSARLFAAALDYRDARVLAAYRADQLVAASLLEASRG